ncbi:MAG: CHASE2 domain-containing protein [Spirochaetaceae bacterium]
MKKNIYIIIPLFAVLISSFLLIGSLDNKIYDIFLRTIPSLTEDPSVVVVKIDDPSIENVGIFPWPRDIMADAIIFMREMGSEAVAFDLSYLDNSPVSVNLNYLENNLPEIIDSSFAEINSSVTQIMDAFASEYLFAEDALEYKEDILESNKYIEEQVNKSLSNVTRDVDAYFGNTLNYFGDSYLTLTMVSSENITGDSKTFNMPKDSIDFLSTHIALKNINYTYDSKTPEVIGIVPSIPKLVKRAKSAGFVNAAPDNDGFRRRVHLVMKFNGKYYGQLALVPLLVKFGNPKIIVTDKTITLKDAKINSLIKDIVIPRTEDGSVLIKWPKKEFKDYNQFSAWYLINNSNVENTFIKSLKKMDSLGFFISLNPQNNPIKRYNVADKLKNTLMNKPSEVTDAEIDEYKIIREEFITLADDLLNGSYEEKLLSKIHESSEDVVKDAFNIARKELQDLLKIRSRAHDKMDGTLSIIGFDATSMTDVGQTTFQELFPNVGIYSAVANMIIAEEFLDDAPGYISIIIALILSVILSIFIMKQSTKNAMIAGFSTIIATSLITMIVFVITKRYIGLIVPLASLTVTFLTLSIINFLTTSKEKSFLRTAFSRYLSPEVISEIIADPSKLNLGGEKREMTAFFTDIKGFSTISEILEPGELVKLLNMYLTKMSNIVMDNRGTIDKYEGDAIIAFFGAPISMKEHAILACKTAILMKEAEIELNKYVLSENLAPFPIFTRIGINTGDMIVGNMGTPNKMDYTIMGNSVNLAARLEGINKQYNTNGILISEHTRSQIGDEFLLRKLDMVRVVGVNTPLRLYELIKLKKDATQEDLKQIEYWNTALTLYEEQKFEKAKDILEMLANEHQTDKLLELYITRCKQFITNPPDKEWDGVFNLTEK